MKKYFKIINASCRDKNGKLYHKGLNISSNYLNLYDDKCIYVTDIKYLFAYIDDGPLIIESHIPDDAIIIENDNKVGVYSEYMPTYSVNKLYVDRIYKINTDIVKMLINNGALVTIDDYHLFRYALLHNYDLWKYLNTEYKDYSDLVLKKFYLQ